MQGKSSKPKMWTMCVITSTFLYSFSLALHNFFRRICLGTTLKITDEAADGRFSRKAVAVCDRAQARDQ